MMYWKSTYRLLFSILLIGSAFLTERFVFPALLKVSWQGSVTEELIFLGVLWIVSSLFIGITMITTTVVVILRMVKSKQQDGPLDRAALASQFFSGSLSRWMMSLAPCIGPPLALAIVSNFFHPQLYFPDTLTLLQACVLLGLITFVICLPLTLYAQQTLQQRVAEKFPGVKLEEDDEDNSN